MEKGNRLIAVEAIPHLQRAIELDPNFALALALLSTVYANNAVPANTMADVLALARKEPGKYSFGTAGNGTFSHLLMESMKHSQKVNLTHVPYKGVAPALTDLIGGQISYVISTMPAALPFIKSGQLKPISVLSLQRSSLLSNVPIANDTVPGMEQTKRPLLEWPAHFITFA